ncbi:uncharacterized protein LOC130736659 [Lotus japonicus]|uniref:uncharacterized protein LOC130736659 n=1 Tax=Lotus japonicus TaxID=34305 RepID=UPI0025908970|nr:uncharacterized protein LOC130736659 [Lotus japonicus]
MTEPDSLWCKVVKARCETRGGSSWWNDITSACVLEGWNWFENGAQKLVREGNDTAFWTESWLGNESLQSRFPRLYNLSKQKRYSVKNMGMWSNGVWHWDFKWRRSLRGREEAWLEELMGMLMFENANEEGDSDSDPAFASIWTVCAPSNVRAFVWRLLLDRLPTRDNLRRRHLLGEDDDARCPLCQQADETSEHLFSLCPVTTRLWSACYAWRGMQSVLSASVREHFLQFPMIGRSKKQQAGEWALWMSLVWTVWMLRNKVVFQGANVELENTSKLIQVKSWQWVKAKVDGFSYSWFEWRSNPSACMDLL